MKLRDPREDATPYPGDETVWFDSLAELLDNIRDNPAPLNEVIGWAWRRDTNLTAHDLSVGYPESGEYLSITVAMPRVRMWVDWSTPVSEADGPAFRAWLETYGTERAARWLPFDS